MLKKSLICLIGLFILSVSTVSSAIDGGPTGWWSDSEGNNYYGDAPSYSSSSSSTSYNSSSTSYNSSSTQTWDNQQYIQQQAAQQEAEKREVEQIRRERINNSRQQKKSEREQRRAEEIRRKQEEQDRLQQEKVQKEEDFKKGKEELVSSLKGSGSGRRLQEDYYKTLKIGDVPLRSSTGRSVTKEELRREKADKVMKDMREKKSRIKDLNSKFWAGVGENKEKLKDWMYLRALDETFNQVPIVSGLRSLQKKTKTWYTSMKELAVGVYEHGMGNFERGVGELGNSTIYHGTGDDGVEEMGNKTRERAGELAGSEIEGKGSF